LAVNGQCERKKKNKQKTEKECSSVVNGQCESKKKKRKRKKKKRKRM